MARSRNIKEFDQACRDAAITESEQYKASEDFHAYKEALGNKKHWIYRDLVAWLREWKEDQWQQ